MRSIQEVRDIYKKKVESNIYSIEKINAIIYDSAKMGKNFCRMYGSCISKESISILKLEGYKIYISKESDMEDEWEEVTISW